MKPCVCVEKLKEQEESLSIKKSASKWDPLKIFGYQRPGLYDLGCANCGIKGQMCNFKQYLRGHANSETAFAWCNHSSFTFWGFEYHVLKCFQWRDAQVQLQLIRGLRSLRQRNIVSIYQSYSQSIMNLYFQCCYRCSTSQQWRTLLGDRKIEFHTVNKTNPIDLINQTTEAPYRLQVNFGNQFCTELWQWISISMKITSQRDLSKQYEREEWNS